MDCHLTGCKLVPTRENVPGKELRSPGVFISVRVSFLKWILFPGPVLIRDFSDRRTRLQKQATPRGFQPCTHLIHSPLYSSLVVEPFLLLRYPLIVTSYMFILPLLRLSPSLLLFVGLIAPICAAPLEVRLTQSEWVALAGPASLIWPWNKICSSPGLQRRAPTNVATLAKSPHYTTLDQLTSCRYTCPWVISSISSFNIVTNRPLPPPPFKYEHMVECGTHNYYKYTEITPKHVWTLTRCLYQTYWPIIGSAGTAKSRPWWNSGNC